MTVKEFFKSTAFKCIAVLTSVLLISGVLLAICWGFLEVTDEERFNRKIGAVYGGDKVTSVEQDISDKNTSVSGATIQKVWYIEEKNDYLVQAASRGNGGNVTCWIAVSMDDDKTTVTGISKVLFYSTDDAAEYVGNIPDSVYNKFPTDYTDGKKFTYGTEFIGSKKNDEFIGTGASFTMTAVCNDVNGAVEFIKAYAKGEEIVKPPAEYQYTDYLDETALSLSVNGTTVNYTLTTQGGIYGHFIINIQVTPDGGVNKISKYEIVQNGSSPIFDGNPIDYKTLMSPTALDLNGKTLADIEGYIADTSTKDEGGVLHTGATISNSHCYYAAAFALANYDKVIDTFANLKHTNLINTEATAWAVNDGEITYNVVTINNAQAKPFSITITVSAVDGTPKITGYEITTNGSTKQSWADKMSEQANNLKDSTLADIEGYFADERTKDEGGVLHTGATRSNELCYNAAAFALANYETCLKIPNKEATENE